MGFNLAEKNLRFDISDIAHMADTQTSKLTYSVAGWRKSKDGFFQFSHLVDSLSDTIVN